MTANHTGTAEPTDAATATPTDPAPSYSVIDVLVMLIGGAT